MHELGVTFTVCDTVERVATENQADRVRKVTLELGEVSTVIPEYLTDCWKWAVSKRPLLNDCELIIERIPAITFCESCKREYPTVEFGRTCPHCQSEETYLLRGNEFNIKEIEVE